MKLLDIFARRNNLPIYTAGKRPADWLIALIVLTELRYESFTPNHIRVSQRREAFTEPMQLGIHIAIFAVLQSLPQVYPTILAFEVLLAIYILWTSMQMVLRYKTSPALFGPLYKADSLSGFWYVLHFLTSYLPNLSTSYLLRTILTATGLKPGTTHSHHHAPPSPTTRFVMDSPSSAYQPTLRARWVSSAPSFSWRFSTFTRSRPSCLLKLSNASGCSLFSMALRRLRKSKSGGLESTGCVLSSRGVLRWLLQRGLREVFQFRMD